jgi:hypothetical protein
MDELVYDLAKLLFDPISHRFNNAIIKIIFWWGTTAEFYLSSCGISKVTQE